MPALKACFNDLCIASLVSILQELVKLFAVFLHILVESCSSISFKDLLSLLMDLATSKAFNWLKKHGTLYYCNPGM